MERLKGTRQYLTTLKDQIQFIPQSWHGNTYESRLKWMDVINLYARKK
jgi:hypothetical protein